MLSLSQLVSQSLAAFSSTSRKLLAAHNIVLIETPLAFTGNHVTMEFSIGITQFCRRLVITLFGIYNLVGALSIVKQPHSIGIQEGRTFTLDCVVQSRNQAYVVWYKEESPGSNVPLSSYKQIRNSAPEAERLAIIGAGNTYNLRVIRANSVDEGRYQCVAYSRGSSVKSLVASVTVLPPGDAVSCHLYPQHVHIGAMLNYTCRPPESIQNAVVTWWRGTQQISSTVMLPDGGLKLRYIVEDIDNYVPFTCIVGYDITQANGLNCSIVPLHVPMTGNLNPHYNRVPVGSNAAFRCSSVAAPPVNKIKWLVGYGKTSKISGTGGRYEIKGEPYDRSSSTLIIKHIARSDNGTIVRCVMMNEIKQKQIAMAYVIVSGPSIPPQTTLRPGMATNRPMFRRTTRPRMRTQRPMITTRRRFKPTLPPRPDPRTTGPFATKRTTVFKPPRKPKAKNTDGVEISVAGRNPTRAATPSVNINNEEGETSPSNNHSVVPAVASICVLLVLIIAISGFLYFAVFRRKLFNKKNLNGEVRFKKPHESNHAGLTAEERAAARMSLRLQTIEVVVNQPPPEWQSKLTDVKRAENNEYTNFANAKKKLPESPPPAYTKKHSPKAGKRRCESNENQQNGVDRENELNERQENDTVYALPAKKPCGRHGDNSPSHQNARRKTSDSKKRLLSQDYNDNRDDLDDEIEWDQSSWDSDSFEDEEETAERVGKHRQMYSGQVQEQIYANTTEERRDDNTDDYGPEYGNLPNMDTDETDPTYSRVASLTNYL